MKKIAIYAALLFTFVFHTDFGMEIIRMDIKPQANLELNDGSFQIDQSDYDLLKKYSITMKEYEIDTKQELKEFSFTQNTLILLVKYLFSFDRDQTKFINQLKSEKIEDLNIVLQAADYLNIPDLVSSITDELATRFNSRTFISQFMKNPAILNNLKLYPSINNLVAKKILEKNSPLEHFLKMQLKFPVINKAVIPNHANGVFAINPQNTVIAFGATKINESKSTKGIVNLYDTMTSSLIHTIDDPSFENAVYQLAFSPDGTMLGIADQNSFYLYNAMTYKPIKKINARASAAAFTSDSKKLAFNDGATVNVWDFEQQNIIFTNTDSLAPGLALTNLTFSPNNELLAGSFGYVLIVWNLGSTQVFISSALSQGNPDQGPFVFTPDSSQLLVGLETGTIHIEAAMFSRGRETSLTGRKGINSLGFNGDGSLLVSGNDSGVDIFDWQTKKQLYSLVSSAPVWFAKLDKTNTKLISLNANREIIIYDLSPILQLSNSLNNLQIEQVILLLLIYQNGIVNSEIVNANNETRSLFNSLPQNIRDLLSAPTPLQKSESMLNRFWYYFMKK